MANLEAVASFDWAKEYKLEASAGAKLKAGISGAVTLQAMAAQVDADLKLACGGLAKDLGATGEFKTGEEACKAAIKAMGDARAKIGGKLTAKLVVQPPQCSASMDAMAECAGKCDASVSGGKAEVTCEPGKLSGSCEAKCSGKCELSAGGKCDATCEGSCDAQFKGKCDGTCTGKCDNKDSKGQCAGVCDGKCDAGAKGECKGTCGGSCELKGQAECKGTCTGDCSVKMKEPKCAGKVEPPKVSAECKASCDAKVSAKLECTPAKVLLALEGGADAAAQAKYKAAIEKNLPVVLKIAIGMKDRVEGSVKAVSDVVGGVQAAAKASGGGPTMVASLGMCIASPLKGVVDAAASLKASVNVSVDVKASASASGSASGKAG